MRMIGGQCDKCVCEATSVGSLQRRRPAPPFATTLIAISALYISTRGNFDHYFDEMTCGGLGAP